jgi:hypothetical protein
VSADRTDALGGLRFFRWKLKRCKEIEGRREVGRSQAPTGLRKVDTGLEGNIDKRFAGKSESINQIVDKDPD